MLSPKTKGNGMRKLITLSLIIMTILTISLTGCKKNEATSSLPYEAVHLGDEMFVVTKTNDENAENLYKVFEADFKDDQELEVGETYALNFEGSITSFDQEVSIVDAEKLAGDTSTHNAGFELADLLTKNQPKQTYLIDVRTPSEFASGHVPKSINIPVEEINDHLDAIPDKEKTVLVYCRSGNRSAQAAKALSEQGYKVIFDLGGISNYQGSLEKGDR